MRRATLIECALAGAPKKIVQPLPMLVRTVLPSVLLVVASVTVVVQAQQITPGLNNNLSVCTSDEYICDPYLRQKNEPKGACSALNSEHCIFVANDYSGVKEAVGDGTGEAGPLNETLARLFGREAPKRIAAIPDAWIGVYRCYHGAAGPCVNGLWPGFPADTSDLAAAGPEHPFATASDPDCWPDDKGLIGCVAMFFNRPGGAQGNANGVIVTRFFRDYNDESRNPIRLDPSIPPSVLVAGSAVAGKFADLCTIFNDGRGTWYVGWTQFHREGSHIWVSKSTDGKNWSPPQNISNPSNQVQRVVFAADKRPLASGGGTVHAMFRTFAPDTYQLASLPPGADRFNAPINVTARTGPASACVYDAPSTGSKTQSDPLKQFARARDFASIDTAPDGAIYVAHTERINPNGTPLSQTACTQPAARSAPAAIVLAKLSSSAQVLTNRKAIDIGQRCETAPAPGTPPTDVSLPNGACPSGVPRAAGVQMQPVLRINGGNVVVMYREGRGGIGPAEGYFSGRPARMDMRTAQIDPANLSLLSTAQISQYEYVPATGNYSSRVVPNPASPGGVLTVPPEAGAPGANLKTMLPNLPLHEAGTVAFMGDSDHVIAAETYVTDQTGARWATAEDVPALRMIGVWGADTRETGFPLSNGVPSIFGPWPDYRAPGSADCTNPTTRFSNVFASVLTNSVEAWAVQTFKPLGVIWRSWPIVVRHFGTTVGTYRLTLVAQDGFRGSFDEREGAPDLRVHDVKILPGSSISLGVFGSQGSALDVKVPSPIKVFVDDVTTKKNPDAIIRLNPNPIQYDQPPLVGPGIQTIERHGRPTLSTLSVKNYSGVATSPSGGNPNAGAPNAGAPNAGAPNAGATSITDIQYVVTTGETVNTTSGYVAIANFAGSYDIDAQTDPKCKGPKNKCHDVQTIFSRTHTVPTVAGCSAGVRSYDEIIGYTAATATPNAGAPNAGAPNAGAPNAGAPNAGAPNAGAPNAGANSFTLTPSSAPAEGTLAAAAYANRAIASAFGGARTAVAANTSPDGTVVGDPPIDAALVTFRIIHYHDNDVAETAPTTPSEVENTVGVAVVPEAEKNKAGGRRPLAANDAYTATQTTTLPISAPGVLGNDVGVIDDASGNTVPLTAQLVSGPTNGTLTFNANGSFEYKPKGNFVGLDYFRYIANEGTLTSPVATVQITVVPKKP